MSLMTTLLNDEFWSLLGLKQKYNMGIEYSDRFGKVLLCQKYSNYFHKLYLSNAAQKLTELFEEK